MGRRARTRSSPASSGLPSRAMSSTSPGVSAGSPATTMLTSAAGKQVVRSRHARASPSRTSASTAHWRPVAYRRWARCCSASRRSSSSLSRCTSGRSGSLWPRNTAGSPSHRRDGQGDLEQPFPVRQSRPAPAGAFTRNTSTTRRPWRCRTRQRSSTCSWVPSGIADPVPSTSTGTSTSPTGRHSPPHRARTPRLGRLQSPTAPARSGPTTPPPSPARHRAARRRPTPER